MEYYASSDIGGTFTDTAIVDKDGRLRRYKASTVPSDPVKGILATLDLAARDDGIDLETLLSKVSIFSHGTTIATNAVLTRNGSKVGLLQTYGFGDSIFINRGYKSNGLDEATRKAFGRMTKPEPFVERRFVREIVERVDSDGTVLAPLDDTQARKMVRELVDEGITSFAVALVWSILHPEHERRLREIIIEELPDAFVTLSSDILPRLGELARTQTAVLNSFLGPTVQAAMTSLQQKMEAAGLPREPLLMRSNGGLVAARFAADESVGILLSGPVGGVVGAQTVGAQLGHKNIIATDMGGTSFDVGLIVDGRATIQRETYMERQAIALPSVTVDTVGSGGGSIASVVNGRLKVGPESAGAVPGPACYGAGGTEPTVTDADVVLGLVNPDNFLGARIKLDGALARQAIDEKIAKPLGLSVEAAALGIKQIVDAQMADLVRQATIYRGYDPRDFVMVAYGGAGPTHAYSYGADLGVRKIIIPRTASILSAHGILISDLVVTRERATSLTCPAGTDEFGEHILPEDINGIFAELEEQALTALSRQDLGSGDILFERYADIRFKPQIYDISVDVAEARFDKNGVNRLIEHFIVSYETRFGSGSAFRAAGIEVSALRVVAHARLERRVNDSLAEAVEAAAEPTGSRAVYEARGWVVAAIYDENAMRPGVSFDGPAVVELKDTTLVVGSGQSARVDERLNVIIEVQ